MAYRTGTFHRGTEIRGTEITVPRSARFSAHVSYKHAGNHWTGRHSWGDRSLHPCPPASQTAGLSRHGWQRQILIRKVMIMRVFVAGGAGVLGQRLVPQLVARGHQVTATTTSAAKLDLLARLGADGVVMMTEGRGFSNAKAKRELGWELRYPSWRQGFKEGMT